MARQRVLTASWAGSALLLALLLTCAPGGVAARRGLQQRLVRPARTTFRARLSTKWLSNTELSRWADEFVARCGPIAKRHALGKSVRGAPIWAIEISDRPGVEEAEPNFKYIGNMHGDEISGRNLLPLFAEWLCANNGADETATRIVAGMHTFLVPTMNPDGFSVKRRSNRNGFDLNRNFPDQFKSPGADLSVAGPSTQKETAVIMAFLKSRRWAMGANFHEGALVVNYPWDGHPSGSAFSEGYQAAPDDDALLHLSKTYSRLNPAIKASREFPDEGVTNGAEWYPVYGGLQDWDYVVNGGLHLTLEVSQRKSPSKSAIPTLWEDNREAMVALAAASMDGVSGTVTSQGGAPLAATLTVKRGGSAPVPFRTAPATGFFARPLVPGKSYTLAVSAPGFVSQEAVVAIPAAGGVLRDFVLAPARR